MQLKVGEIVEGTVKSLTKFGAFVALDANTTGLVHISEVAHTYVSDLHEYLTEGQTVKVMVIGLDNGKINLSIKRTLPAPTRQQSQRPRGGAQQRQAQPNRQQPSAPQQKSFDDMLKQFMSESDSKMSSAPIPTTKQKPEEDNVIRPSAVCRAGAAFYEASKYEACHHHRRLTRHRGRSRARVFCARRSGRISL